MEDISVPVYDENDVKQRSIFTVNDRIQVVFITDLKTGKKLDDGECLPPFQTLSKSTISVSHRFHRSLRRLLLSKNKLIRIFHRCRVRETIWQHWQSAKFKTVEKSGQVVREFGWSIVFTVAVRYLYYLESNYELAVLKFFGRFVWVSDYFYILYVVRFSLWSSNFFRLQCQRIFTSCCASSFTEASRYFGSRTGHFNSKIGGYRSG